MKLTEKDKELVAIGAAVGSNCVPCLEWHYEQCVELGMSKQEIKEAIAMAKKVRGMPSLKLNETVEELLK
jgi:4-carboxymuconolactone decarboxylase